MAHEIGVRMARAIGGRCFRTACKKTLSSKNLKLIELIKNK